MILLSPTRYPMFHASLLTLMILMSIVSLITLLLTYKKFLKGPFKSYILLNVISSITLLLFFTTYILYEMDYHSILKIGVNIDIILLLGFFSAIVSFIISIISSIKLYKISKVFGFSA